MTPTKNKIDSAIERWMRDRYDDLYLALAACESEIERLLCLWFLLERRVPKGLWSQVDSFGGEEAPPLFIRDNETRGRLNMIDWTALACVSPGPREPIGIWIGGRIYPTGLGYVHLFAQLNLRPKGTLYRVDFGIVGERGHGGTDLRIVVETDGHDFHERTKEQAARDKRRDRELSATGWTVLRFTGSEVWRDPGACVTQVQELLIREDEKAYRTRLARGGE